MAQNRPSKSTGFIVDGYTVRSPEIREIIEKLTEADGAALHQARCSYLSEAAALIVEAAYLIVEEEDFSEDD